MPERITTVALIAKNVAYGETDRVCTLLTPEQGRISVLAKAARRSRRRFGGALGLFVVGEALIRPTRGELGMLERFEAREDLAGPISQDVVKVAHGSYMLELARELWPPGQGEPALFEVLASALRVLASQEPSPGLLRSFELKVLGEVGLLPALDHCAACGLELPPGSPELSISIEDGGILCANCGAGRGGRPVSAALQEHLTSLVRGSLHEAARTPVRREIARGARDLLLEITRHQLGKELRSLKFISQLVSRS